MEKGWTANYPAPGLIWFALTEGFENGYGTHPDHLILGSDAPPGVNVDIGEERSGAGWKDPGNFLITSAFVRLLGTLERFEMDVLKALFFYRPSGLLGVEADQITITASSDVFLEEPEKSGDSLIYRKPAVWTWLRKQAENNVERRKIFSQVFGIKTVPDSGSQLNEWYEKRNRIAHGRQGVRMLLGEYINVDVFISKCMRHVSEQCEASLKLIV